MTENETIGWHHRLNGHEFEQVSGVGDGQGSLVCCSPWGCKELDMTEQLNLSELKLVFLLLFAKSLFFLHSLVQTSSTILSRSNNNENSYIVPDLKKQKCS